MAVTVLHRIAGEPAPVGAASFGDVPAGQWYSDAVAWAAEKEIAQGFAGRFRPNDKITRQELVTLLYRYDQLDVSQARTGEQNLIPAPGPEEVVPGGPSIILPEFPDWIQGSGAYTDLDKIADWAVEPFVWAMETGVITGNDDGTLDPQGNALRCQFAAMIQRYHQTIT